MSPAHLARAAVDGIACSLAYALDQILTSTKPPIGEEIKVRRVLLVGGAGQSRALRQALADVTGLPIEVPAPGEYVALGAARQAAWVLSGAEQPPVWDLDIVETHQPDASRDLATALRQRYEAASARILPRS